MNETLNIEITDEVYVVLSKALREWSDKRYMQLDGSTIVPANDMDGLINGMLNFTGKNLAKVHGSLLHLIKQNHTKFNYQMAHQYADHFMEVFIDSLENKE